MPKEILRDIEELDRTMLDVTVIGKIVDKDDTYSIADAEIDADEILSNMVKVDYRTPGTCGDERHGAKLLSGEPITEIRPKVFGGPLVFGYVAAEFADWFGTDEGSLEDRFVQTAEIQEKDDVVEGGGHEDERAVAEGSPDTTGCAANDKVEQYTHEIALDPEGASAFVEVYIGDEYDDDYKEDTRVVLEHIIELDKKHHFAGRDPFILVRYLGDRAGRNMEVLAGKHLGKLANLNRVKGTTLDRDAMQHDTFDHDISYAEHVLKPLATGVDPERMLRRLKIAGALMVFGITKIIPNEELVATQTTAPSLVHAA